MFKKELWLFTNLTQYFADNKYVYTVSGTLIIFAILFANCEFQSQSVALTRFKKHFP
jgi:hypothetical protein